MEKLIVGNWKMSLGYQASLALAQELKELSVKADRQVAVCPSPLAMAQVAEILATSAVATGAQNVAAALPGALTGETSLESLVEIGGHYVILGHSERRQYLAETDSIVHDKAQAVLERSQITPIICVGEDLATRQTGQAEAWVEKQLRAALANLAQLAGQRLVIAYEPIWAIGTGETSTPEQAEAMHQFIRQIVSDLGIAHCRILYGGSAKPENAASLLAMPNIDGLLVGGASLTAASFAQIVNA